MARKRRGDPVHGWIVLDKPQGVTANTAVGKVRRALNAQKAGHAGTLDPLATGVLPIALGEATKTVAYAMDARKTYRFTARWGEARNTDDAEGIVVETSDERPDELAIQTILSRFTGAIQQIPPTFSAIKVDGKRAYALARAERDFDLAPREVEIHALRLLGVADVDHAEFEAVCGKGTYIRSLVRDLARAVDTVGHVSSLRRTAVGRFTESTAISLDKLETIGHSPAASEHLLPVETALDDIPALAMTDKEADRIRNGQPVPVLRADNRELVKGLADGAVICAMAANKPLALVRLEGRMVHPVRVLNL